MTQTPPTPEAGQSEALTLGFWLESVSERWSHSTEVADKFKRCGWLLRNSALSASAAPGMACVPTDGVCPKCGAPSGQYHRDGCKDVWWPHNKVNARKAPALLSFETDIEMTVHMVGDAISRDEFSVERVTADLNERIRAMIAAALASQRSKP